jgi:hypothetical protein
MHGVVTMGPTSTTCFATTKPCTKPAAHALVQFLGPRGWRQTATDGKGRYSVVLEPGVWNVRISLGVATTPHKITVRPVTQLRRDFRVDTGIR